ncbi:hypothetical protein HAV15_001289 [Penicillium sp. str. |nr:hypothetical protein HAV15_001289 [Penicillium sp. str. \
MATSVSPPCSLDSSRTLTGSSHTSRPSLSLDIANMPALSQPTPPSNTLLITDLHDLLVFQPPALEEIRNQITAVAPQLLLPTPLNAPHRVLFPQRVRRNSSAQAARRQASPKPRRIPPESTSASQPQS